MDNDVNVDMQVFIPSRSRGHRSITLEVIMGEWPSDKIFLVIPANQKEQYRGLVKKHQVHTLLCPADGIARTREWIGRKAIDKFLCLDDDLRFYRRGRDSTTLYKPGTGDVFSTLLSVERFLDSYKHVAISARGGNNQLPFPGKACSRPLRALAYRKREFLRCHHGRVAIMEDFDITLQLLRQGFANWVITEYAQDQPVTNAPGGCSDYRTHKLHADNVKLMAKLHAPFVKLREKENKTGGEFGKRLEATIYWQKAFQSAFECLGE